jgi:hypothetical protein
MDSRDELLLLLSTLVVILLTTAWMLAYLQP